MVWLQGGLTFFSLCFLLCQIVFIINYTCIVALLRRFLCVPYLKWQFIRNLNRFSLGVRFSTTSATLNFKPYFPSRRLSILFAASVLLLLKSALTLNGTSLELGILLLLVYPPCSPLCWNLPHHKFAVTATCKQHILSSVVV